MTAKKGQTYSTEVPDLSRQQIDILLWEMIGRPECRDEIRFWHARLQRLTDRARAA